MKIQPQNAAKAVQQLYAATRQRQLEASEHELLRACHDGLHEFIGEVQTLEATIETERQTIASLKNVVRELERKLAGGIPPSPAQPQEGEQ